MVMQPRALATRQKIVDAAVTLFAENGYLETDLKAITREADLTPGAFYYHFGSKEELVAAITAEGWSYLWDLIVERLDATEPGLANVMATTIAMADLFGQDKLVWVASQLNQAFGHLHLEGRRDLQQRFDMFVEKVSKNIQSTEIRADVTQQQVSEMIWIMLQGSSQVPSIADPALDPIHEPVPRAVTNWIFLLRAVAHPDLLPRFEQALKHIAAHYATGGITVEGWEKQQRLDNVG